MLTAALSKLRSLGRLLQKPLPAWATLALLCTVGGAAAVPTYAGLIQAYTASSTVTPLIVKGAASQTADMTDWENSSNVVASKVDDLGGFGAPYFYALSGNAELCPAANCTLALIVDTSGDALSHGYIVSGNGEFVSPSASNLYLCANDICTNMPHVGTNGAVQIPELAASQAGTITCRDTLGDLEPCSFPTGTVSITSNGCADGAWCGKALVGTFSALGSSGCDIQYFYSSTIGYQVEAFPIYDLTNSKIWAGFVNHTGAVIPGTDTITATYACPYFGN